MEHGKFAEYFFPVVGGIPLAFGVTEMGFGVKKVTVEILSEGFIMHVEEMGIELLGKSCHWSFVISQWEKASCFKFYQ
jgi:hypothetical protein